MNKLKGCVYPLVFFDFELRTTYEEAVEESYYAAVYAAGETREWYMDTDSNGYITHVEVGGKDTWFMLGYYSVSEECFLPYDAASGSEKEWLQNYQILQYNTIFDAEERCSIFCVTEGEIR